jgi:hypothetical protein
LRDLLCLTMKAQFGAEQRRSWGSESLYSRGRLFVLFSDEDLVGKWPDGRREVLRASGRGVRPFMSDDELADARWLRVPLHSFSNLNEAVELCLEAAEYVHSPEGAPTTRRRRTARA